MTDLTPIERDEAAARILDAFDIRVLTREERDEIYRLCGRLPLYVRYFQAVEARGRQPFDCTKAADELYAARKALLEDTDGRA